MLRIELAQVSLLPIRCRRAIDLFVEQILAKESHEQSSRRDNQIVENTQEDAGVDPTQSKRQRHPPDMNGFHNRICNAAENKQHNCCSEKPLPSIACYAALNIKREPAAIGEKQYRCDNTEADEKCLACFSYGFLRRIDFFNQVQTPSSSPSPVRVAFAASLLPRNCP